MLIVENKNHDDKTWMRQALKLAIRGQGQVEPNPMVGCVLVKNDQPIGEGWHEKFGGPHAEVNAIRSAQTDTADATAYVTLEPCAHHGKTPPCSQALIDAKVSRVVIGHLDPNPRVAGQGVRALQQANIQVETGGLEKESAKILAPYFKLLQTGKPWLIGKWAMTLDGKIATATGSSQWISNATSRETVHQLRGRMDAILVGSGTALADDPLLTARPAGHRVPLRVVLDSQAKLASNSQLCQTASQFPTLIAVGPTAVAADIQRLKSTGCEIWLGDSEQANERLLELLAELGRRQLTNVLVEGGGQLLGSLHDLQLLDEVHVFIGSKLVGGQTALGPIAGQGIALMSSAQTIEIESVQQLESDIYIIGRPQ